MRLYASTPVLRGRQVAADAGVLAWLAIWVLAARAVHRAVLVLAEPGRAVADLGASVSGNMATAADAARGVPLVGDDLSSPFTALGAAGDSVGHAGQAAEDAVGTLAWTLAVVLVLLPVGWAVARWLPWRLRWAEESRTARRLLTGTPDLELLAARAIATAPLPVLAALPPGTGTAWRSGDPAATRALAAVELRRVGLQPPSDSGSA